jgi:hypothetical protein
MVEKELKTLKDIVIEINEEISDDGGTGPHYVENYVEVDSLKAEAIKLIKHFKQTYGDGFYRPKMFMHFLNIQESEIEDDKKDG